jgi:arginine decarboxylase-like protein
MEDDLKKEKTYHLHAFGVGSYEELIGNTMNEI